MKQHLIPNCYLEDSVSHEHHLVTDGSSMALARQEKRMQSSEVVATLILAVLLTTGCAAQHQYVVERVKDVNGNDAFLRIDLTDGEECAIGHGFAVMRLKQGSPSSEGYLVPFCGEQNKGKNR